ncbi:unnamed protein product [Caenorhabditis angaria]|uniref:Phosphoinositide phospholipase C n=1 Tax=Caenorhabditis angaria TaxID=860376 RepID=A0A9P1N7A8_9PELO|nr:unnamed protein product [Caenorhabditis angaria]
MDEKENKVLLDGELKFFLYDNGNSNLDRLNRTIRLRVDPHGYILYWRYKDKLLFKQKELSREKNYIFLEKIYDVRVGNPTNLELSPHEQQVRQNFLTIVSGQSITNLKFKHFVYLNKEPHDLQDFAEKLFRLVQKVKSEEHGLLYHFRKKLAPNMYALFSPRCIEEDIIRIFDQNKKTTKNEWVSIGKLLSIHSRQNVNIDDQKLLKIICILTKLEGSRLESVFRKISEDEHRVSREEFGEWVRRNQHDHRLNDARFGQVSDKKIDSTFDEWNYQKDTPVTSQMFAHWMMSDDHGVVVTAQRQRLDVASMRDPINRYFIDSSHNTYCSGNQLVYALGKCAADVEMYRQVLLAGCRCIELDVWDNKDKDEAPVITHGPTAVMGMNEISLIDVCLAIKEYAFKTSAYPLILSIENHLSRKQQEKMVQIFRSVFGDLLLTSSLSKYPLYEKDGKDILYPSPEELKYKILIKAKKKFEKFESRSRESSSIDLSQQSFDLTEDEALEHQIFKELSEEQQKAQLAALPEETSCSELSAIINYMQAFENNRSVSTGQNIDNAKNENFHCIVSVDENLTHALIRNSTIDKVQSLAKSKLIRVYPKASRIYSTNYCPMIHWLVGSQMVALNYQTNCHNMQLNYAMFERNGGSGYVRKPDYMRFRDIKLKPRIEIPFTIAYTIEVEVLSAYFLSSIGTEKFRRRSSISVHLFDVPDVVSTGETPTGTTSSNRPGGNSCRRAKLKEEINFVTNYDRYIYRFDKVMLNDLSFLQFNIHNESNNLIAQRVLHLDTINNGYRFVILRSPSNQCVGPASLLVRFDCYMHSDRKNLRDHKQMYNPHAFDRENDIWARRFSNPFADFDESDQDNFLLVEGTRRGAEETEPTTPTGPSKPISFAHAMVDKIAFWKKK